MRKNLLVSIAGVVLLNAGAQTQSHFIVSKASQKSAALRQAADNLRLDEIIPETLDSSIAKTLNPNTNLLEVSNVYKSKYDANGNIISTMVYNVKGAERALNNTTEYAYNAQNRLILESYVAYENGLFAYATKTESFYNTSGNILTQITTRKTTANGNFLANIKQEYTYTSGKLSKRTLYRYEANAYKEVGKTEYSYNTAGQNILIVESGKADNVWKIIFNTENVYNTAGQLIMSVDSTYSSFDGPFEAISKLEYTYDAKGNTPSFTAYENDNDQWIPTYKTEFTFDLTVSMDNVFCDADLKQYGKNKVTGTKFYVYDEEWVLEESETEYYSAFNSTAVTDVTISQGMLQYDASTQTLSSTANTTFDNATVVLYDLQGKAIASHVMDAQGTSLQQLSQGMYVYQFVNAGKVSTGKILVP